MAGTTGGRRDALHAVGEDGDHPSGGAVRAAGETDGVTGRRQAPGVTLDAGEPAASVQGRWNTSTIYATLYTGSLYYFRSRSVRFCLTTYIVNRQHLLDTRGV